MSKQGYNPTIIYSRPTLRAGPTKLLAEKYGFEWTPPNN
jgi:hypothetical protein